MSARVYGSVTDAATGTLIATAIVSAPPYSVINASGNYYFLVMTAATIDVTASAPDYTPQTKRITVAVNQLKQLNFALNHI